MTKEQLISEISILKLENSRLKKDLYTANYMKEVYYKLADRLLIILKIRNDKIYNDLVKMETTKGFKRTHLKIVK